MSGALARRQTGGGRGRGRQRLPARQRPTLLPQPGGRWHALAAPAVLHQTECMQKGVQRPQPEHITNVVLSRQGLQPLHGCCPNGGQALPLRRCALAQPWPEGLECILCLLLQLNKLLEACTAAAADGSRQPADGSCVCYMQRAGHDGAVCCYYRWAGAVAATTDWRAWARSTPRLRDSPGSSRGAAGHGGQRLYAKHHSQRVCASGDCGQRRHARWKMKSSSCEPGGREIVAKMGCMSTCEGGETGAAGWGS
jgi:hypothetical protein